MAPVFLVLTTGKWAIEGDVMKREFFKKSIAERTWEREVYENVWINDWSSLASLTVSSSSLTLSKTRNKDKNQYAGWWIKILSVSW
jgi:hypothetical protein